MKILVADDEALIRDLLEQYLTRLGHLAIVVTNGAQALETLREQEIDIVLTDRQMPVMSGLELLKQIKADPSLATKPIACITGRIDPQTLEDIRKLPFDAVLTKPFNLEKIQELLNGLVAA